MPLQPSDTYYDIRWMLNRDHDTVLEIEGRSFESPWTKQELLASLKQRNVIGCVYQRLSREIEGYMVYSLHKERLEILNLAVAPESRRNGIGRTMIQRLIDKLAQQNRQLVGCWVSERNVTGQLFLAGCGLRAEKTERDRYESGHDGIWFEYRVGVPAGNRISGLYE